MKEIPKTQGACNALFNALQNADSDFKNARREPVKATENNDARGLGSLMLDIFRVFHLREFSANFDSHPEEAPNGDESEEDSNPGISPCGGIKLYRQEALDSELTRSILSCKLESNFHIHNLIERFTLACAESNFPFWADSELGGFGTLNVSADGAAVLNFTQRSENPDDDTEYTYYYYPPVTFKI